MSKMKSSMKRDWKANPPKGREDGFALALEIAQHACDGACNILRCHRSQGPRPVRTEAGYDIVWPDGEVTNQIGVELIQ